MAAAFPVENTESAHEKLLYHFRFKDTIKNEEHSYVIPGNTLAGAFEEILQEENVREWLFGYFLFLEGFSEDGEDCTEEFTGETLEASKSVIRKILYKPETETTMEELEELITFISHDEGEEEYDDRPFWLFLEVGD